jgi:hypothetical protein
LEKPESHFPEKIRLRKPVKTQFEAVFGGWTVFPEIFLKFSEQRKLTLNH